MADNIALTICDPDLPIGTVQFGRSPPYKLSYEHRSICGCISILELGEPPQPGQLGSVRRASEPYLKPHQVQPSPGSPMLATLCVAMPDDDGVETTFWQPLTVQQTVELMAGLDVVWWIAGGWAIDLFLNRSTRNHKDTDLLILRKDQIHVARHFAKLNWEWWAVDRPGHLKPLERDEIVSASIHDIWCRRDKRSAWALQLMLGESIGDRWIYRRDSHACPCH